MVNAELIDSMKDGAVLINCSRYGVVDEEALAAAKAAGKNIGYLTDVHPKDAPGEKPSAAVADLILPHLGANTREANTKAAKRAANPHQELNGADFSADLSKKQIYLTPDRMKEDCGESYDEIYSKYKSIVEAVKGEVLTYKGELIMP